MRLKSRIRTFCPRWPHFFSASWSSKCSGDAGLTEGFIISVHSMVRRWPRRRDDPLNSPASRLLAARSDRHARWLVDPPAQLGVELARSTTGQVGTAPAYSSRRPPASRTDDRLDPRLDPPWPWCRSWRRPRNIRPLRSSCHRRLAPRSASVPRNLPDRAGARVVRPAEVGSVPRRSRLAGAPGPRIVKVSSRAPSIRCAIVTKLVYFANALRRQPSVSNS